MDIVLGFPGLKQLALASPFVAAASTIRRSLYRPNSYKYSTNDITAPS
jgi:hypothetical protein